MSNPAEESSLPAKLKKAFGRAARVVATSLTQAVAGGKRKREDTSKLEFTKEIKDGIDFLSKTPPAFKLNTFADIPSHPNMVGPKNDDRLIFTDDKAYVKDVMFRQVIADCKGIIEKNDEKKSGKFYLYGMHGTGKSHTLYTAALYWLHDDLDTHRLLYFGDCGVWADSMTVQDHDYRPAFRYLLEQLAVCFCKDEGILEVLKNIDTDSPPSDLAEKLKKLFTRTIPEAKLHVWVVFDQHNRIPDDKRQLFPFTIVEKDMLNFNEFLNTGGRLIVSASANNEYKEIRSLTSIFQPMLRVAYTDEELEAWKKKFKSVMDDKLDFLYLTGHVPYQLANLLRNITRFEHDIREEIRGKVNAWRMELSKSCVDSSRKLQLHERATFAMKHQIALTSEDLDEILIDRRFQYDQPVDDTSSTLYVITPLSPLIGEKYGRVLMDENLKMAGWSMLKEAEVDNGTKGRIVESLVVNHLVAEKKMPVPDGNPMVPFRHVVRWFGQKSLPSLKEIGDDAKGLNILFWPRTSNYVDVDFLFWERSSATLWAVQITISETHSFTFQKYANQWRELMVFLLPLGKKKDDVTIKFVWWGYYPNLVTEANKKLFKDQLFFSLGHFAVESKVIPAWKDGHFLQ